MAGGDGRDLSVRRLPLVVRKYLQGSISMTRAVKLSLLLLLASGTHAFAAVRIKVLTYNQYLGGDIQTLAQADDLNAALVALLEQIAASHFPERAQQQAKLILRQRPHLVALQEAWTLECVPVSGDACDDPRIAGAFQDFLAITLDALGPAYELAAVVRSSDYTSFNLVIDGNSPQPLSGVPFTLDGEQALLLASEQVAILARTDSVGASSVVDFPGCTPSLDGCLYDARLPVDVQVAPGTRIVGSVARGFVGVDATVGDRDYRFVTTHLEIQEPDPGNPLSGFFQAAQAAQLIGTLDVTPGDGTVIVAGDLNSAPTDEPIPGPVPLPPPFDAGIVPPYQQFVAAGYADVWELRPGSLPGFTCCQDADLRNRKSKLGERIDLIFSSEELRKVRQASVLGARTGDKTRRIDGDRLWPSDHGGVVAQLRYQEVAPGIGPETVVAAGR
jgi:endonuclease/exonuclease/phosphatase family metal-dependent hydrolase